MSAAFVGFPEGTVAFLEELPSNNSKAWFDEHREQCQVCYMAPTRAFVQTMGEALREFSPDVRADPRVNGSISRVNRDIRFSAASAETGSTSAQAARRPFRNRCSRRTVPR